MMGERQRDMGYAQTGGVRIEVKAAEGGQIDTVGALLLGLVALALVLALLRSQGRNRRLMMEVAKLTMKQND